MRNEIRSFLNIPAFTQDAVDALNNGAPLPAPDATLYHPQHEMNHLSLLGNCLDTARDMRLVHCREGWMLFNARDMYVGKSLEYYGEFSQLEMDLFASLVQVGDTVLDIGANIGAHTLGLARAVGATGHVIAFEPQRYLYHMLCANAALNGCRNVYAILGACGVSGLHIDVPMANYNEDGNFGCMSLDGKITSDMSERVPLYRLDELTLDKCGFIKIDVEGMELEVLKGSERTLARCRPVMYIENDRMDKFEVLNRWILEHGYRLYWHNAPLFHAQNFFQKRENIFGGVISWNVLAIPKEHAGFILEDFEEITDDNAHIHPLRSANASLPPEAR